MTNIADIKFMIHCLIYRICVDLMDAMLDYLIGNAHERTNHALDKCIEAHMNVSSNACVASKVL